MAGATLFDKPPRQDLAAGKAATQSSVFAERRREKNPNLPPKTHSFHTNRELNPWWKIDLEAPYEIQSMVLFNRLDVPGRLRFFTILFSLDDEEWSAAHTKTNAAIFGGADGNPYVVMLDSGHYARYIMVRLDGLDCLHFDRLEVYGSVPVDQPRLMVEAENEESTTTINISNIEIYLYKKIYSEIMIGALTSGDYLDRKRNLLEHTVFEGDRVLDLGTGTGLLAMLAAKIVGVENVMTIEGSPQMVEHATKNFELNEMKGIHIRNGVLKSFAAWRGPQEKVKFYISRNFWASRLVAGSDIVDIASVPVLCLEHVIRESGANVMICDIEGGEIDLLKTADLGGIDTIMLQIHYSSAGIAVSNRLVKRLINQGFSLDLDQSAKQLLLLKRGFTLGRAIRN